MKPDWNGKRVTILGGARQGLAAARWLARHGAIVTVNDRRAPDRMVDAQAALADIPVAWVLGSHPVELLERTDVLCISGGIPLENPLVVEAVKRGLPLTNDTQIFMEVVPCKTVGITGSAGKTTTTTLVGQMASAALGDKAHVGGNIGDPLLNYVDEMAAGDLATLEISSFQLEQMTLSPQVAAVLNITPNHLDRHGTMEAYTAAKKRILDFQGPSDTAVLCREDAGSWGLRNDVHGRLVSFGFGPLPANQDGSYLADGILHMRQRNVDIPLLRRDQIQLRGEHNVMNVLAAFAIGFAAGLPLDAMLSAAEEFKGAAHRMEFIREWNGAKWFNDSIATAPERTIADIRSFTEPLILLLGGRDKNLPWDELAALVRQRVDHVVLFGEAGEKIEAALAKAQGPKPETLTRCKSLGEAVQLAANVAQPGDVVLLSPGGTSFDQFTDFEERGEAFRKWVSELS
ncbi:MAG TPA: UDP-N-acetylmuramoyl-L-alanine--D-glutamate ligase [Anaerolineales bacterium]|nr:UDP-N-acetylmuramoyl-L-alanine--D-glutamate ligase [Anaerolineales bacterium]